jgi:CheY-like chemotaxis protein
MPVNLRQSGFEVTEAATDAESLKLAKQRLDLNAFEICQRLKADLVTRSIPVLHLSAASIRCGACDSTVP